MRLLNLNSARAFEIFNKFVRPHEKTSATYLDFGPQISNLESILKPLRKFLKPKSKSKKNYFYWLNVEQFSAKSENLFLMCKSFVMWKFFVNWSEIKKKRPKGRFLNQYESFHDKTRNTKKQLFNLNFKWPKFEQNDSDNFLVLSTTIHHSSQQNQRTFLLTSIYHCHSI